MVKNDTKERFLEEALFLFAEKGYRDVTVADISGKVGYTPPALYKHYKGKKELFDKIVERSQQAYAMALQASGLAGLLNRDTKGLLAITEEDMIDAMYQLMNRSLDNPMAKAVRRIYLNEQFRNEEMAKLYNEEYVYDQINKFTELFRVWMDAGKMKKTTPRTAAIMFSAPLSLAIEVCDRTPDYRIRVKEIVTEHVHSFWKVFEIR